MTCGVSCFFASYLVGGVVYGAVRKRLVGHPEKRRFEAMLDPYQRSVYAMIVQERMRHAVIGFVVGTVLGMAVCDGLCLKGVRGTCTFAAIALASTGVVYGLLPKSAYMLQVLKTRGQVLGWLEVYKMYRRQCLVGGVIGLASFLLTAALL